MKSFNNLFEGKKVLITGNTGFKGSWLSIWLLQLGAKVYGLSKDIPSKPSMFESLKLQNTVQTNFVDIRDIDSVKNIIKAVEPDFLFHLAAQPIVSKSYENPLETISTNIIGTANILESLRLHKSKCTAIIITSDKCYENFEWEWGYKETDILGGKDIYSGSKGSAENIFHAYYHSFFKTSNHPVKICSARAGNVIGGGDWAKDRIIADAMISWSRDDILKIRSPQATRPWQHVLEPLSGYLSLAQNLYANSELNGQSFNFGPNSDQDRKVKDLLDDLFVFWSGDQKNKGYQVVNEIPFDEAGLLKLNCDKALFHLNWKSVLKYHECINMVGSWYKDFYQEKDMWIKTIEDINNYEDLAYRRELEWIKLS